LDGRKGRRTTSEQTLIAPREQTRARYPDTTGTVDVRGVAIGYEVYGSGGPALLLLPAWTIVHVRFWKTQIPYLARHYRVVTYDGPGNGLSARTLEPDAYGFEAEAEAALAVLDASDTARAALITLSRGAQWALWLAAHRPERVLGLACVAPAVPFGPKVPERAAVFAAFDEPYTSTDGWAKYNRHYWLEHYEDFLQFFFERCFPEPHSTKQVEDCVGWGLETAPEVLVADAKAPAAGEAQLREWAGRVRCPVLVAHGDADEIVPIRRGVALAELTRGLLVTLEGSGHFPHVRDPVRVNLLIREFVESLAEGKAA
jgi:pimeloyl-ACP methyl ester carboxylesterase